MQSQQNRAMNLRARKASNGKVWLLGVMPLLLCLGGSLIVSADTPSKLWTRNVGGCYCQCAAPHGHNACVKMCDSPRFASRPWATHCVKPRLRLPIENHDAGPRYPHPGRAERAANRDSDPHKKTISQRSARAPVLPPTG